MRQISATSPAELRRIAEATRRQGELGETVAVPLIERGDRGRRDADTEAFEVARRGQRQPDHGGFRGGVRGLAGDQAAHGRLPQTRGSARDDDG